MSDVLNMKVPLRGEEVANLALYPLKSGDIIRYSYMNREIGRDCVLIVRLEANPDDSIDGRTRVVEGVVLESNDPENAIGKRIQIEIANRMKPLTGYVRRAEILDQKMSKQDWRNQVAIQSKHLVHQHAPTSKVLRPKKLLILLSSMGLFDPPIVEDTDTQSSLYKSAHRRLKEALNTYPDEFYVSARGIECKTAKPWADAVYRREGAYRIQVREHGMRLAFSLLCDGVLAILNAFSTIEIVSPEEEVRRR